jgi:hypothetical protein
LICREFDIEKMEDDKQEKGKGHGMGQRVEKGMK